MFKKSQPLNIELSETLLKKILESKDNKKIMKGYIVTPTNKIKNIISVLSEKYKIEAIGLSEKYEEYIRKQIEYNIFEGSSYKINTYKWTSKQIDNIDITSSKIIEAIENNDYKTFRKLVPQELWVNFEQIREEIKKII